MEILKVPKLNENMEAAMVGPWAVEVGQAVSKGDVIVELITDKASFELQAGENGVLRVAAAPEKSTLPVGYALAVVASAGEEIPDLEAENAALLESYSSAVKVDAAAVHRSRTKATPAARRLAREKRLDLSEVSASLGIEGVVDKAAVQRYIREA
jgi:pyruvate/2-oxoglutarate dehydrogenase complex dihydrolipoamide acyltransferase (E2) component